MDPKVNRRIKKNTNYKKNLERREGITKKLDYIDVVSDGIFKSENKDLMNGKYEYVTTRNNQGNVVTRMKFTYSWNPQARALQKLYHETKNGIEEKPKKPIELFFNVPRTKEEIKEYFKKKKEEKIKRHNELPFSKLHYKLVASLYPNKTYTILKQEAEKASHDTKIKELMDISKTKFINNNITNPLINAA